MDVFITRFRLAALKTILTAYRPNISVEFCSESLGFGKLVEFREWWRKTVSADGVDGDLIECRAFKDVVGGIVGKKSVVDIRGQL
jgi:hypothetical protein